MDILFCFCFIMSFLKIFKLSMLFTCRQSGMQWAWPYIDGFVLWLDIKYLVESVDDCYEHCMPSINICWVSVCNLKLSASQSWRIICCYKWFIHFYFDWLLKLTWHCAFFFELSGCLDIPFLPICSPHWRQINLPETLLWWCYLSAQCPSITSN